MPSRNLHTISVVIQPLELERLLLVPLGGGGTALLHMLLEGGERAPLLVPLLGWVVVDGTPTGPVEW